jgi:hypothetical protein
MYWWTRAIEVAALAADPKAKGAEMPQAPLGLYIETLQEETDVFQV